MRLILLDRREPSAHLVTSSYNLPFATPRVSRPRFPARIRIARTTGNPAKSRRTAEGTEITKGEDEPQGIATLRHSGPYGTPFQVGSSAEDSEPDEL